MSSIDIKINTDTSSLKDTRDRIKEIKSALIDIEDPEEFAAMSLEAAELETKLRRVNSQISMMSASGDDLARLSGGFKNVGKSILSLDFTAALEQAKTLEIVSKGITFKGAISSLKNLGKTFVSLGRTLLTNPIFLLATAITLIVIGIVALMDKLGLLEKVMAAIGAAIDYVIGLLKSLTDWLGLTSHAQDEMAKEAIASNERIQEQQRETTNIIVRQLDREIDRRRALGESIKDLEEERAKVLAESSRQQAKEQGDLVNKLLSLGKDLNDEEVVEAREKHKELISISEDAEHNLEMVKLRGQQKRATEELKIEDMLNEQKIKNVEDDIERERLLAREKLKQRVRDFKSSAKYAEMDAETRKKWIDWFRNERDKIEEETENKIKARNNKRAVDFNKRIENERKEELKKARFLEDLRLNEISDEIEKDMKIALVKEQRLFEDLDKTKLSKDELELVERVHQANLEKIRKDADDKRVKRSNEIIEAERVLNNTLTELDYSLRASRLELIEDEEERKRAAEDLEIERLSAETEIYLDNLRVRLEEGEITEDEFRLRREIAEQEHSNKVNAIYQARIDEQKRLDKEKEDFEAKLRADNMSAVEDTSKELLQTIFETTAEGSAISKAAAIASTTIDTYKAAMAAYSSVAGIPIVGPALGVAAAGAAIAVGASAVKNILSTPVPGGGGGGGAGAPSINTGSSVMGGPTINMTGTRGDTTRRDEGDAVERPSTEQDKIRVEVLSSDIVKVASENDTATNRASID